MPRNSPPRAPAPWHLRGDAWIAALSMPGEELDREDFLPPALRGKRLPGTTALLMLVDYQRSDVGPYQELLFIPGRFRFPDGGIWPSISRILVSTTDSVVNGRTNWGLPKEQAEFRDIRVDGRQKEVAVNQNGRELARLHFRHYPPPVPVSGALMPARWRTLAQHHEGHSWRYAPLARGLARPARLLQASADPAGFPDLNGARTLAALHLSRFQLTFPAARLFRDPA